MEDNVEQGTEIGVVLIFAVVIAFLTAAVCGILRKAYIVRDNDVAQMQRVTNSYVWEELHSKHSDIPELEGMVIKKFDGATWGRILYQDISNNTNYFTAATALNCDDPGRYSKLAYLENFRMSDGKFEFMLDYPDCSRGPLYNRWKQVSNPVTEQRTNGGPRTDKDAVGFEAIHMDMPGYSGKGLEWNGGPCVLDGTVSFGNWWLCVGIMNGSYAPTNKPGRLYTMPGVHTGSFSEGNAVCELWVRIETEAGIETDTLLKWITTYNNLYSYCLIVTDPTDTTKTKLYSNFALTSGEKTKLTGQYKVNTFEESLDSKTIAMKVRLDLQDTITKFATTRKTTFKPVVYMNRLYFSQPLTGVTGLTLERAEGNTTIASDYELSSGNILVFVLN